MKIGVLGAGYVGLVTATCLADLGHEVCCVDIEPSKVERLNRGQCPIYEPGLERLIVRNRKAGRLLFSTDLSDAVAGAEVVFIAVGTPPAENGEADLAFVRAAAADIAARLGGFAVVVTKSTVPVGTGDEIERVIGDLNPEADFAVVSNPEFLREGSAVRDFLRPDRIVVGAGDARARAVMRRLYEPIVQSGAPLLLTDRRTAELVKYAANAFLAVKISYINEIADLCEELGADAATVAEGMGLDPRIGRRFLQPGPGYGGSCFPKDTQALLCRRAGDKVPLRVIAAAAEANAQRKRLLAARVAGVVGDLEGKSIAVLGLTFKAGTDDLRESAALELVPALQARGAQVSAFDPKGMEGAKALLPGVRFCRDALDALDEADAAVVLTEWEAFRKLDLERAAKVMRRPLMIDLRNLYDPDEAVAAGFSYVSVGRAAAAPRRPAQAPRPDRDSATVHPPAE